VVWSRRAAQPTPRIRLRTAVPVAAEVSAPATDSARRLKSRSVGRRAAPLRLAIDEFVQAVRSRCYHRKKLAVEIARRESTQFQFDLPCVGPFANCAACRDRNHVNARARIDEPADLRLADFPRAHDQALLPCQLHKHWEQTSHRLLRLLALQLLWHSPPAHRG